MAAYKDLTDEEYDKLDEYYTTHLPKTVRGKPGVFARKKAAYLFGVDDLSAAFLTTKAMAAHTTPSQIISEMVRKELGMPAVVNTHEAVTAEA
jgi:hypothetical protein